MKKIRTGKRICAVFFSMCLLLGTVFPAFAETSESEASSSGEMVEYEIPDMTMKISLPEDAYVFEKDTLDLDSPDLIKAGLTDQNHDELIQKFDEYGTYIIVVTKDRKLEIDISKKESLNTQSVVDLGQISDEEFEAFLDKLREDEDRMKEDNITMSVERYEHPENPFFALNMEMEMDNGGHVSELCYGTIVNGYTISVDGVVLNGELTEEHRTLIRQITDSIVITERQDRDEFLQATQSQKLLLWCSVGLLVLIVVIFVLRRRNQKKKDLRRRELADQLSHYHFEQQEREEELKKQGQALKEPETLFRNSTLYTEKAAGEFVQYHILHQQLLSFILYGILALAFLLMGIFLDLDFFNRLLFLAVPVMVTIWVCLTPKKLRKTHIALFRKAKTQTNEYMFRDKDFRISGIQSSSVYPYFQITNLGESQHYFFLYFGEDMAYYVAKDGFTQGTEEEFRKFIQKRTEKKRI